MLLPGTVPAGVGRVATTVMIIIIVLLASTVSQQGGKQPWP